MNSIAMPEARLHFGEELQDLRLDRDVERRRRLVGDEQVGLVRERHRDHDALALPARELVRIGVEAARCVAQADKVEHLERALARRPLRQPAVQLTISPTCRSIVCSGLSELIGSWNTMVMSSPRTAAFRSRRRASGRGLWKRMLPEVMRRRIRQELQDREGRH